MIVWTDLETTGLDENDPGAYPLEIAIVVTEDDLTPIAEMTDVIGFDIQWWLEQGNEMHPVTHEMHTKSGLFDRCLYGARLERVQAATYAWLADRLGDEKPPLGGSTISFDRAWMGKFFSQTLSLLHYRNIDVSSIKELNKRWRPDIHAIYERDMPKEKKHRALDDIHETLREIAVYKDRLFNVDFYLTGTGQQLSVHPGSQCMDDARPCTIHRPSNHHMRSWPTHWREDRRIMERICPHGCGHPDPDGITADTIHGCDGCCRVPDPLAETRGRLAEEAVARMKGGFKP